MRSFLLLMLALLCIESNAQKRLANAVYVAKEGVLRYTADKKETSFWGVNYTLPFAYGYRSHLALGVKPEAAIDADVAHMARLGVNAFRVHVWDVEISDSLGNLVANEHLRLFDYLLSQLKKHNIKILITPIAFWGNGYPEPDVRTNGFSYVHTKGGAVVKEAAFLASENYLKQFFRHVNPYTGLTYRDDPDVIAMEINNEPQHTGAKLRATEYVNRMAAAVRSTGWTKPVFYNISESPAYADAIVQAKVDGHSFQWYPTGLVANRTQRGNFLPNVDRYLIPFTDTIKAFNKRARMVYEFDAGDIDQPLMYPAMAKSFREAGFQWATQFAYDPMHTAYANTEYQTHFLNLLHTPSKAISLLIGGEVFRRWPRGAGNATYPADTLFDVFRISYREGLSEMNSPEAFYHTGTTLAQPVEKNALQHIAGVGSSPVVDYEGTGAYFLDRMKGGGWRLEIYPDAITVSDPFAKASPQKTAVRLQWRANRMVLNLPGLSDGMMIVGGDDGNDYARPWSAQGNQLKPGIYYLLPAGEKRSTLPEKFYALPSSTLPPVVLHQPYHSLSENNNARFHFEIAGFDTTIQASVELRHSAGGWRTISLEPQNGYTYSTLIPADYLNSGRLRYRVIIQTARGERYTYPGGSKGDPYAWDAVDGGSWESYVAPAGSTLSLFNPSEDGEQIIPYLPNWRQHTIQFIGGEAPRALVLKASLKEVSPTGEIGWQFYFADKLKGREKDWASVTHLLIRARASAAGSMRMGLITKDGDAYAKQVAISTEWQDIYVPIADLQKGDYLLLPRPYPSFQALRFTTAGNRPLNLPDAERLELRFGEGFALPASVEVAGVYAVSKESTTSNNK